uniref:Morc S5 domain-containing protein n=1 Tax=Setaria viridis TaxID=4556 RepID=A0A4U6V1Y6_SETVI|nr:hypothetical protein SEVIR_4G222900v2 [Setaria viridis]
MGNVVEVLDVCGRGCFDYHTGAMKLGKDVVVLTQTSSSRSVAFLSQSFNEGKGVSVVPVIAFILRQHMELDLSIQSEATAKYHLNAIKYFSPFTKYYLGEKIGLFGEEGTGTQIYIWNLDKWGTDYTLEWNSGKSSENPVHKGRGDILIRSRRVRSRQGQLSNKVPLDYSLQSYLEVMFLNPHMKISVQGSLVKSRSLAKTLNNTSIMSGEIMGRTIVLTLGMSKIEFERMNCGIFFPYKRVGGQKHSVDTGRGLIGVADITDLIELCCEVHLYDEDGHSWVLNNKQGFKDCEVYAKLEEWLSRKVDEYWDATYDNLEVKRFCYMPPFNGKYEIPQQEMGRGAIVVGEKRSGYEERSRVAQKEKTAKKERMSENSEVERTTPDEHVKSVQATTAAVNKGERSSNGTLLVHTISSDDDYLEGASSQTEDNDSRPTLTRLRRGPR